MDQNDVDLQKSATMDQNDVDLEKSAAALKAESDGDDVCPVREVELTVPKTDDPTMPVYTFRMWLLGIVACVALSFINQFFWYRKEPLNVSSVAVQVAVVPIGHFMAAVVTTRVFFQGTRFAFTLNPGPFNIKEHVLITILANSGSGGVYATHIISAVRLFYKRSFPFIPAFIVMLTTQLLGYGWAGIFRKFLVEPARMWWPGNLVQVALFRALHEREKRPRGRLTRTQFFLIASGCSFCYAFFPNYFFLILSNISWLCWFAPTSVTLHQIGSGLHGLGVGSFALDWNTVVSFLGSPLASPWHASANVAAGYALIMYVLIPIGYWTNLYNAKSFPIYSRGSFLRNGQPYNTTQIMTPDFHLDRGEYASYGKLYLSTFFALTYGLGFACLPATLVHVFLFHGREVWRQTKAAFASLSSKEEEEEGLDVHGRLMKKYPQVPMAWFLVILVLNIAVILFAVEYYKTLLQLPWWGVLLACAIALAFTLPIGIIAATTMQAPGLNIITEYIIGYAYAGYPVANMCFKVYGYISMTQALSFVSDFKLGHYMKIPPRAMFNVQVIGTIISVITYTCTAWWMMATIPHLCDVAVLGADTQWSCPSDSTFYTASVLWGLVGPQRMFGNLGVYPHVNWFFLGGAVAPLLVWAAAKAFPSQRSWISLINMPILLGATSMMPPATAVNFTSWIIVAAIFGRFIYRNYPEWWGRYNYVLSGGLDLGSAFATMAVWFTLRTVSLTWWGNSGEGCPLATCPTAKGVVVDGCPVF